MNVGDSIRNSNSWHWLCVAVVAAAAASVFLPTYGWRDVLQFAGQQLASDEARAQKQLDETRALAAVDVAALAKETEKAKKSLAETKAAFVKYGIEELPTGDKAVFSAQSRVGEALNRRRLRVISTEARVAEKAAVPDAAKRTVPVAARKKQLTADEFLAQSEKAAAAMKDRKLADMVLSDARKKHAQMIEMELTVHDIKEIITNTSDTDKFTEGAPQRFGSGKMNAYKGLLYVLDIDTSIPTLSKEQPKNVSFRLSGDIVYADGAEDGIDATVYNLQGVAVRQTKVQDGAINLAGLQQGVYAIQLGKLGSTLIRK